MYKAIKFSLFRGGVKRSSTHPPRQETSLKCCPRNSAPRTRSNFHQSLSLYSSAVTALYLQQLPQSSPLYLPSSWCYKKPGEIQPHPKLIFHDQAREGEDEGAPSVTPGIRKPFLAVIAEGFVYWLTRLSASVLFPRSRQRQRGSSTLLG